MTALIYKTACSDGPNSDPILGPENLLKTGFAQKGLPSTTAIADGADGVDVDAGEVGEGPEPMTIDSVDEGSEGEESEEEERGYVVEQLILQT